MATPDASRPLSALGARVGDAAAALSEAERTALVLRDREEPPYARIAEVAGVAVADVPDLLVGARLAVREAVRDADSPPLPTADCPEAWRPPAPAPKPRPAATPTPARTPQPTPAPPQTTATAAPAAPSAAATPTPG